MRGQVGAVRGGGGRASEQFGALAARMLAALEATQAYQKATLHKTLKFTYVLQDVLSETAASCTDGGGDVHEDDPTAASAPSQAGTRLDMTGDGHHESVGYDTTGDGRIDALDTVGDGRVDARIVRGPPRAGGHAGSTGTAESAQRHSPSRGTDRRSDTDGRRASARTADGLSAATVAAALEESRCLERHWEAWVALTEARVRRAQLGAQLHGATQRAEARRQRAAASRMWREWRASTADLTCPRHACASRLASVEGRRSCARAALHGWRDASSLRRDQRRTLENALKGMRAHATARAVRSWRRYAQNRLSVRHAVGCFQFGSKSRAIRKWHGWAGLQATRRSIVARVLATRARRHAATVFASWLWFVESRAEHAELGTKLSSSTRRALTAAFWARWGAKYGASVRMRQVVMRWQQAALQGALDRWHAVSCTWRYNRQLLTGIVKRMALHSEARVVYMWRCETQRLATERRVVASMQAHTRARALRKWSQWAAQQKRHRGIAARLLAARGRRQRARALGAWQAFSRARVQHAELGWKLSCATRHAQTAAFWARWSAAYGLAQRMQYALASWREMRLHMALASWRAKAREQCRLREVLASVRARLALHTEACALKSWAEAARRQAEQRGASCSAFLLRTPAGLRLCFACWAQAARAESQGRAAALECAVTRWLQAISAKHLHGWQEYVCFVHQRRTVTLNCLRGSARAKLLRGWHRYAQHKARVRKCGAKARQLRQHAARARALHAWLSAFEILQVRIAFVPGSWGNTTRGAVGNKER